MLHHIDLEKVLVLDIETVPQAIAYDQLDEQLQAFWEEKCRYLSRVEADDTPASLYQRAGIYAEFGKIVCISAGFFHKTGEARFQFRLKSFRDEDEKQLLLNFSELLNTSYNKKGNFLCAHNGKEFDYPYISRRMIVNEIPIPGILDIQGKKPWEAEHLLDTMQMWKFGDYKSYTSLALIATILGIGTPKDDIKGSDVGNVYWKDKNLERIVTYCQKDVVTVAQILLKFKYLPLLSEQDITIAD